MLRTLEIMMTSTSTPAPYTTSSGTGFNIQINWDSSVASAPAAFITDVEQVANFFASALQGSRHSPITISIDVGEQRSGKA
jgi:hypothetical protein